MGPLIGPGPVVGCGAVLLPGTAVPFVLVPLPLGNVGGPMGEGSGMGLTMTVLDVQLSVGIKLTSSWPLQPQQRQNYTRCVALA